MTIPTGAPTSIASLATILAATSAYTGAASTIYYPEADGTNTGLWAVLDIEDNGHVIYLCSSGSAYDLENMAVDLRDELPSLYRVDGTGLYIGREIDVGTRQVSSDAALAGRTGTEINCILLTLPTRIQQGE